MTSASRGVSPCEAAIAAHVSSNVAAAEVAGTSAGAYGSMPSIVCAKLKSCRPKNYLNFAAGVNAGRCVTQGRHVGLALAAK